MKPVKPIKGFIDLDEFWLQINRVSPSFPFLWLMWWINFGWVWLGFLQKWGFQKVHNEKVLFQKAVKKCFLKKLSVWLALIKVAVWEVNYQKGQCIYKGIYFILKSILWNYYFFSPILANNNLSLKIYCESIVKILW